MAKKVGSLEKGSEKKNKKKKGKQPYDSSEMTAANPEAVNADGLLTIVPAGYDYRKNIPLKKEEFINESVYLRYRALISRQKSEQAIQLASDLEGRATRLEKFGSETARRAATKLARAKQQMGVLRQQLIDTGMDEAEIDELIANM